MANISRYVFSSLITSNGTEPYIYKNKNNVIFSAFAMSDGENQWLDLFYSEDDGDNWTLDKNLPISEDVVLRNPRIVQCGDILYVIASGIDPKTTRESTYIIRKYFNVIDDDGSVLEPFWDTEWTQIIYDNRYHCRLTDVAVDSNGFYMFLAYDKMTTYGTYEERLCVFSLGDFEVKIDTSASGQGTQNHHGGKLALINDTTIALTWQRQNASVYNSKNYQILYQEYDLLMQEWGGILLVSNDDKFNNFHPSITVDSAQNVYVSWLHTENTNVDGSVKYYEESSIFLATIQQGECAGLEIISQDVGKNEYPYLVCDEYDNLYVMFNGKDYVNYLTRKVGMANWTIVTNIQETNWKILVGFCYDGNLYTVSQKDDLCYMLRIDTLLAEDFSAVKDFQVVDVDSDVIKFAWTSPRNAEDVKLQGMNGDLNSWTWEKPKTTEVINVSTDTVYCVGLEADTIYAFKLVYKTTDKKTHTLFYPRRYISQHDHDENYKFSWTIPQNIVEQTLFVAKEAWSDIMDVPNTADTLSYQYGEEATVFRLSVTGGMADGYSNEVSPLLIELDDSNNYKLSWSAFKFADYVEVQQSIDRIHYYPAKNVNINPQSEIYIVNKLNDVTYSYRLLYGNKNIGYHYTNVVSLVNNLKPLDITYNSVTVQWNDVVENEKIQFQYSIDEGNNWTTRSYPITSSTSTIKGLECNKDYWVRMYFPNRFTGKYSNVVKFKTKKHPVENFEIENVQNEIVDFSFVTTNQCSQYDILVEDAISGNKQTFSEDLGTVASTKTAYTAITDKYSATIWDLKKGTPYLIQVVCRNCDWEYSNVLSIQTYGDAPQGLKCTTTGKHTATLKWDALDRITNDNIEGRVTVEYSLDENVWEKVQVKTISQPYTLEGLMQDTTYYVRLKCTYGDNKGTSKVITLKTKADAFAPVYGHRNHDETCFCVKGDIAYIFDLGKLYKYDLITKSQELIHDFGISANHIYGDIEMDKNDCIHLVFTYGKGVYYATNCKTKSGNKLITNVTTVEKNNIVNEYLYPNIAIDDETNVVYIVWQENYGYYSNVSLMQYKNGEPLLDESMTIFNTGLHNNLPIIRLDGQGGFIVSALDEAYRLQMMIVTRDNDYTSATYQDYDFDMQTIELNNPYDLELTNYDIWIDNMGIVRIFHDSKDADGNKTSTYLTYQDGEFEEQCIFNNNMSDVSVFAINDFVVVARNDEQIYTSSYLQDRETFSDIKTEDLTINSEIPLIAYSTVDKIYLLSFKQGMFEINSLNADEIVQDNQYVSDVWIDNKFELSNEDLEVNVEIWTNGNPKEYPQLFMKVNHRIIEITPTDEFGDRKFETIMVSNFEEVTTTTDLMKVKITFNGGVIEKELTKQLCYSWDKNKTIVNKDEN